MLVKAKWSVVILEVQIDCQAVSSGSTGTTSQTIYGINIPGLGTSGSVPPDALTKPITIKPRDMGYVIRDVVADAVTHSSANGFWTAGQSDGTIGGTADSLINLSDRLQ